MCQKKISSLLLLILSADAHAADMTAVLAQPELNGQPYESYLLGSYQLAAGSGPKSFAHFQQLLDDNPSPYAYEGFIQLLFATGNNAPIIQMIPKLDSYFKDNLPIQLIFIQALYSSDCPQDQDEADARAIRLQTKNKKSPELTLFAAQAYTKRGDVTKAVEVIDALLNSVPSHPRLCLFHFLKSQLYIQLNNRPKAIDEAKRCLELCPQSEQAWLLLGMLLEQQGSTDEAISGYQSYLQIIGPNKSIEQKLQRLLVQNRTMVQGNKKGDSKENRLIKVQSLMSQKKMSEALALIQSSMMLEPNDEAWYKSLYWFGLGSKPHKAQAINVLLAIEKSHPHDKLPLLYLADLFTRDAQFDKALDYHTKALAQVSDHGLKTRLWYNMGIIHFEQEQYQKMADVLDTALKSGADFPPLYNLLAYYHATEGHDVTRAQQYLDKALKVDPKNPHFLDTQAVIWLRQQQYDKSKKLLEELTTKNPNDYAMHLHLAKLLEKTGNKERCFTALARAEQLARTTREQKACQRIKKLLS